MAFTTKKSLLAKVRAGDEVSWQEFYETYRPLILLVGRDCGLEQDDRENLVQLVMCEVFQKDILAKYNLEEIPPEIVFQYDPKRGRFRHYFKAIVRNQALKLYQKHKRNPQHVALDEVPEVASEERFEQSWEDEWRKHLLTQALAELRGQVQANTYAAFEMYALQERPVNEIAKFLGFSVASVYVAKNRCIATLKKIIARLEGNES